MEIMPAATFEDIKQNLEIKDENFYFYTLEDFLKELTSSLLRDQ
jgi:hypothetical protein